MAITKYIDKTITGKKNLEDLIRDSVIANVDEVQISYDKNSIKRDQSVWNYDDPNSTVDVTVVAGSNTISANMKYRRDNMEAAYDYEPIIFLRMEDVIANSDNAALSELIRGKVSDRMNIPKTDFTIRIGDIVTGHYVINFGIESANKAETILSYKSGKAFVRLRRYVINDEEKKLGIGIPVNRKESEGSFYPKGKTAQDILDWMVTSKISGKPTSPDGSYDNEHKVGKGNFVNSNGDPIDLEKLDQPWVTPYNSRVYLVLNTRRASLFSGEYTIRILQLDEGVAPESHKSKDLYRDILEKTSGHFSAVVQNPGSTDFLASIHGYYGEKEYSLDADISALSYNPKPDKKLTGVVIHDQDNDYKMFTYLYYPNPEYAQTGVTIPELKNILDDIKDYLDNTLCLPTDAYILSDPNKYGKMFPTTDNTVEKRLSTLYLAINTSKIVDVEFPINYENNYDIDGFIETWKIIPINLIFAKENKCELLVLKTYLSSNNHIGFIEGPSEGWSIGDIEWWMIDAGYIRSPSGTRVTRTDDVRFPGLGGFSGGSYSYRPPPGCIIDRNTGEVTIRNQGGVGTHGVTFPPSKIVGYDGKPYTGSGPFRIEGTPYFCTDNITVNWDGRPGSDGSVAPGGFVTEPSRDDREIVVPADDQIRYPDGLGQYQFLDLSTIKNKKLNGFDL